MIALLRLFALLEEAIEILLLEERDAVDTLHLLTMLVAAPIGAGE